MATPPIPRTAAEIDQIFQEVKTWGRWGSDDERGALNYITAEKRRAAAGLVREGVTVSASLPLAKTPTEENPSPALHLMIRAGDIEEASSYADYLAIAPHGMAHTHLDALCHFLYRGQMYNGFPVSRVTSTGATALSIESGADGIVSRGVLLDVARAKGLDWLDPGDPIHPADLEAAEQQAGLRVESGDILLVRTGRHLRARTAGPWNGRDVLAGLQASCLRWLSERQVAVLGCDGISDVMPSQVEGIRLPVHTVTIVAMGIHLIDNCDLEALATACAERRRWEFLLTLAPLRLPQGTASLVNPIALF
jgi:kynurenine formamidase